MAHGSSFDVVVIGAGPNGLAAAVALARSGRTVIVFEAGDTIGGGCRTKEVTLPGFRHDICSAIYPLAVASPFFRSLPLERYGLEWIHPDVPLAHPLDDGATLLLQRSIAATGETLAGDAAAYARLMRPIVAHWERIVEAFLGPLRLRPLLHPGALTAFGLSALQPAEGLARRRFKEERARALLGGLCAHAMLPLNRLSSAAAGLLLAGAGHTVGWPLPRGGAQRITDALASYLRELGGVIVTGKEITSLDNLPPARAVVCDTTPRQLLRIADRYLPSHYKRSLAHYRYGPGSFKIDYALAEPIPWKAEACLCAGTVHVGGTFAEIAASEQLVAQGRHPERPFVLVAQQSLFDATRAPQGKHTAWAYCHVPNGSPCDMTTQIEAQIERFAPGFRDRILCKHSMNPIALEEYNANYVGGDINGGMQDIRQLFTRPVARLVPYTTPSKNNIFLCSSSTPPGGGVHGMCGYFAAQTVLDKF